MPKLPKPLKGTILQDTFESLKEQVSKTTSQAKKAGPSIVKSAASQVTGQYQRTKPSSKELSSPSTKEVVEKFYGADNKNLIPDQEVLKERQEEEIKRQKKLSQMRQKLKELLLKKQKDKPSQKEKQEMEETKKEEVKKQQAKKKLPPLKISSKGRPKGLAALNPLAWKKYRAARSAEVKGGTPSV